MDCRSFKYIILFGIQNKYLFIYCFSSIYLGQGFQSESILSGATLGNVQHTSRMGQQENHLHED